MSNQEVVNVLVDAGSKAAVPVGVTVSTYFGLPLSEWVYILTIIYLVVHIGYIAWKWFNGK
jgi:putative effector of murein hydrolase LrgA (UPF0299 family)